MMVAIKPVIQADESNHYGCDDLNPCVYGSREELSQAAHQYVSGRQ